MRWALLFTLTLLSAACSRPAALFVEQNARAHVEMLAGTIGSRPIGTPENARARAYIVDQLRLFGYQVRVQETDARRAELGRTARVANIIATLPAAERQAIGLLSHYDSRANTPGGGDDAFGVAVSLEAARVLASQPDRRWSTFVLITDGEEEGLMGAAALMADAQVRDDLAAYINLESIGTTSPSVLFETGPGNGWLVRPWVRTAPYPRGGSYAVEIYKRLPNDTDFTILKRHQVPGLNFAAIGDSFAYHTPADTADRVSSRVLRETGENVVAVLASLQQTDITQRTSDDAAYFDVGGVAAASYGMLLSWTASALAVLLGLLAWLRVTRFMIQAEGSAQWLLGLAWTLAGSLLAAGAMVLATYALRASREAYHPWYATPDRLLLLLASVGGAAAWMVARAGRWIPARARGLRHPAVAWTYTLPCWIALAVAASWVAPAAAYLWTMPLLAAGVMLLAVPVANAWACRAASLVVLAVAATFWLRDTVDLFRFLVAMFGRQPIVTPVFVYAALLTVAGIMIVPPFFATTASERRLLRPSLATALLLTLVAVFGARAWTAPAYTNERPLRRYARVLQEAGATVSHWQIGSLEPGVDLGDGAPTGWTTAQPSPVGIPWAAIAQPFVLRTTAAPLAPPPARISAFTVAAIPDGTGASLTLSVLPHEPGLTFSFVLPAGLAPTRSNLPGVMRGGRWTATYVAPPPEGIAWQASFAKIDPATLRDCLVAVTAAGIPGGSGWQRLPAWMPQERTAWSTTTTWIVPGQPQAPLESGVSLR